MVSVCKCAVAVHNKLAIFQPVSNDRCNGGENGNNDKNDNIANNSD